MRIIMYYLTYNKTDTSKYNRRENGVDYSYSNTIPLMEYDLHSDNDVS
jgi:hypothetical protein